MDQDEVINKLIPADDLYWDEHENKYIALSSSEIDDIIAACYDSGITTENGILNIMAWCTEVRVGEILMRNFLNGGIKIEGLDETGEPRFIPSKN